MKDEVPLLGGRVTQGVVRVGNTVRRPMPENSRFTHALLTQLESNGFEYSPRLLGVDEQRREILSFIDGQVPTELQIFSLSQLREAGRIIALFHDATAGATLAGAKEVVCHNDLSPCNFVFRSGCPVCIIDFDAASPGSRRLDVAYAAWTWLNIGEPTLAARDIGRRLFAFLDAYGIHAPIDPLDAILEAQVLLRHRVISPANKPSFADEVQAWAANCIDWVRNNRSELELGFREGAA